VTILLRPSSFDPPPLHLVGCFWLLLPFLIFIFDRGRRHFPSLARALFLIIFWCGLLFGFLWSWGRYYYYHYYYYYHTLYTHCYSCAHNNECTSFHNFGVCFTTTTLGSCWMFPLSSVICCCFFLFVHHIMLAYRPLESISLRLSLITVAVAYLASTGCLSTTRNVRRCHLWESLPSKSREGGQQQQQQQQRNVYFIAVLKEFHLLADKTVTCPTPLPNNSHNNRQYHCTKKQRELSMI